MRRAPFIGVVAAAVVIAAGVGTGTFLALDKTVTVSLDGSVREVHTFGDTVGDVLAAEGIPIGERDVVIPHPTAEVTEGLRIAVRYARELRLTVDGAERTLWVTATSVDEAFDQIGLRYGRAKLSVSRSAGIGRAGLEVDIATNKRLTIVHDGEKTPVETTGQVVADALEAAGISLQGDDQVAPQASTRLRDGGTIRVTRIRVKTIEVEVPLPYETVRTEDPDLYADEEVLETDGVKGLLVETRRVTYVDGEKDDVEVMSKTIARKPVDEVIRYGTKEHPVEPAEDMNEDDAIGDNEGGNVGGDVDDLNWAALAECESGGNPRAVNPAGYYGLYQFSLPTWRSVGGTGNPIDHSPDEQTYRAKLLYVQAGAGQWPHCGRYLFS